MMESNNAEVLGNNYIEAVRKRDSAYANLARAFGTSVGTAVRTIGQTLVDSSDQVEEILTGPEAVEAFSKTWKESRDYLNLRKLYLEDLNFQIAVDSGIHLNKVLDLRSMFRGTVKEIRTLAQSKVVGLVTSATALLETLSSYTDEVDEAEDQVESALEAMQDQADARNASQE